MEKEDHDITDAMIKPKTRHSNNKSESESSYSSLDDF